MHDTIKTSTITCLSCGDNSMETMEEDSCRYFWTCPNCGENVQPISGDCCVFCSYGDVSCPTVQQAEQEN